MPNIQIKICGTTNLADARYCASKGADYLGFIQYEKSPRYIEPAQAGEIIEWVEGPRSVGVFYNEDAEVVNLIASQTGFDLVQLQGDESPDYCRSIEKPVIKSFRIRPTDSADELLLRLSHYQSYVAWFLLDAFVEGVPGGTGRRVPWDVATEIAREYPVFLAGGINPDNVVEAVEAVRPVGIDLVSGIEEAPGRKSFGAIDRLFDGVAEIQTRSADAN